MANSLLDFVIAVVRDPDVGARYAANPGQAIADAHLTGVTSADVNNLIPMVSDSLSMAGPPGAGFGPPAAEHGNVWASGAAAAALDAFTPHTPAGVVQPHDPASGVITHPSSSPVAEEQIHPQPLGLDAHEPSVQLTGLETPDGTVEHGGFPGYELSAWEHPIDHSHTVDPDHHDFGIHG
ncbi:IniB N-terminal domain-containing protein [Mycobacterium sp. 852002-51057_SCH5723018]|uniref:Rv0340 family IniB-related protein n=1 Tax=Mycobacterium sp. 852002-51057_SCH5723018 TaxID=1834094 RepID=UPI0007FE792B|nr:IniB N-terminal domain-containing protein [Mycobacterium sp. 852002-51057_SCH5723018]OBG18442.1 hypothetical protein A5764_18670 [Mycobacterium sp. 852002-51057_SCH5723018]